MHVNIKINFEQVKVCRNVLFVKAHRKEESLYAHEAWPDMVIVIPEAAGLQYLWNQRVEALPESQKYVQLC